MKATEKTTAKPRAPHPADPAPKAEPRSFVEIAAAEPDPSKKAEYEATIRFNRLLSELHEVRAKIKSPDLLEDDNISDRLADRQEELERAIVAMPAVLPWMIFDKIEILEKALCSHGDGTRWTDSREIAMLGAIKADFCRFGPAAQTEYCPDGAETA